MKHHNRRGSSLIEVLVVMIVLVIGIFSIIRLFPGGFLALQRTEEQSMASQLAKLYIERMKGDPESIPFAIYPVQYKDVNGNLLLVVDPDRRPDDMGYYEEPSGIIDPQYTSNINHFRRVIGETVRIPAPLPYQGSFQGDVKMYGGHYLLKFAPILFDDRVFTVYGSNLPGSTVVKDAPTDEVCFPFGRGGQNTFYLDTNLGAIWLPTIPFRPLQFRINLSYWVSDNAGLVRRDIVDLVVQTDDTLITSDPGCYKGIDLKPLLIANGEQFQGIIWESVQVARVFKRLKLSDDWTDDAYEFKLLDDRVGHVIFNPKGYGYKERRNRQEIPLRANFDYDVLNWHILNDERRVGENSLPAVKLSLNRIKHIGDFNQDQSKYKGIDMPFNGEDTDMAIIDVATGGTVFNPAKPNPASYVVDYTTGNVKFGAEVHIRTINSDGSYGELVFTPQGRTMRFLYEGTDDWGVQVQKASHQYQMTLALSAGGKLGISTYYVGLSGQTPQGLPTRIYFPPCDIGKTVTVRQYSFINSGGRSDIAYNETFLINAPRAGDAVNLGYVDIRESPTSAGAQGFDFAANIAPVLAVEGTSVKVRVVWAPTHRERSDQERKDSYPNVRFVPDWKKIDFDTNLTKVTVP